MQQRIFVYKLNKSFPSSIVNVENLPNNCSGIDVYLVEMTFEMRKIYLGYRMQHINCISKLFKCML